MMAQQSVASLHGITPPVPVISPQFCSPYPVDLAIVVRKTMTITDTNGTLLFQVKKKHLTLGQRTILDALGNPIVTLRAKGMSMHSRCQVFRGASTDPKDLIFTAKTHSVFGFKTKLDVFLAHNTAEEVCDFEVKGNHLDWSCVVYAGHENSNTILAKMHEKPTVKRILLGKAQPMMTVYPNMDHAFVVALIAILDEIHRPPKKGVAGTFAANIGNLGNINIG